MKAITFVSLFLVLVSEVKTELCVKNSTSCTYQLWKKSSDETKCWMNYYTSETCQEKHFNGSYAIYDFGEIILRTYIHTDVCTAFNVTMHDIHWNVFNMRFRTRQYKRRNTCRDFYIRDNVSVSSDKLLYYDCLWSEPSAEGSEAEFQYEYGVADKMSTKRYIFTIPDHESLYILQEEPKNVESLPLFLYVDDTDIYNLLLKIEATPLKFNVTEYEIQVYHMNKHNITNLEHVEKVTMSSERYGIINYQYEINRDHFQYKFMVKPLYKNSSYSSTPWIKIITQKSNFALTIVGLTLLIPVVFMLLYMWGCFSKSKWKKNKILLVYKPSNTIHEHLIKTIAEQLQLCGMEILLDVNDIPLIPSRDPYTWMSGAFREATHVVFFGSPKKTGPVQNMYKNLDLLALNLMKEELSHASTKKQFLGVTFSYADELPEELYNFKNYQLNKDLNHFLNYIENKHFFIRNSHLAVMFDELEEVITTAEEETRIMA